MKILVADDNFACREALAQVLSPWGYVPVAAPDGPTAWQLLQGEEAPRLALIDWQMPGLDGVEICRWLRGQPERHYTYVLLLTARADKEDLLAALEAGADDYLVKPVDPAELRARLLTGRRVLDLQERLLAAQRALAYQAMRDPLTGLLNRGAALDALERELARGWREGKPVGVLLADLDHFKHINDTHGHLAGDAVLYDVVGRYGGEEFLVVLPECDLDHGAELGERLRQCVGATAAAVPEGRLSVTASVGVAASQVSRRVEAEALLRAADAALYRAKRAGRNRVERATPADELPVTPGERVA
jgi:diguanylate cyclase (GGDEF)-like protein